MISIGYLLVNISKTSICTIISTYILHSPIFKAGGNLVSLNFPAIVKLNGNQVHTGCNGQYVWFKEITF